MKAENLTDLILDRLHEGYGFEDIGVYLGAVAEARARDLVDEARRDGWICDIYPSRLDNGCGFWIMDGPERVDRSRIRPSP